MRVGCRVMPLDPLEERHHGFGRTDVDARTFLNIEVSDFAVLYNHGKALTASAEPKT
jgi:hypothetical protein